LPLTGTAFLLRVTKNAAIVAGMSATATAAEGHIFLSHSGTDTQAAQQLVQVLRRNGLQVWFDKDDLQPGDPWMAALEQQIQKARAMIVYIGRLGVEAWVDREVRLGLVRSTQEPAGFRLIPVLGAGADPSSLPPFLVQHQWIDLRDPHHAPQQIQRLLEVLRTPSEQGAIAPEYWITHSPFRSLQVFTPEDAWLFFGRDSETNELLKRLNRRPVLVVLGNSGSGKSSLIGAGLIPALQRGRFHGRHGPVESWKVCVFRPASTPFDELAKSLLRDLASELNIIQRGDFIEYCREKLPLGGNALRNAIDITLPRKNSHILLVADQFEEIFTLTSDADVQERYIHALLVAAELETDTPVHLVLVLRADFYPQCLDHPGLSQCLEDNPYNVPRIVPEQLREIIEKRLALAGARSETGLVDSLLSDVGNEPGDLALLEHALDQLWKKRSRDNTLSNGAYTDIGRLRGALGRHADQVYHEIGGQTEQAIVQRIFLDLVQLGEGAQDTRRRVTKEALHRLGPPAQVEQLLSRLASSRLIQTGGEAGGSFAEVAHEALIREWPALRHWLAENREDLRWQRRLSEDAAEWQKLNRDPGALLQGLRLAQAEEWLQKQTAAPEGLLSGFLAASRAAQAEVARKEKEAQEQTRRAATRFRLLSYVLVLFLLVALGATWFARQQQSIAESRAFAAQAEQIADHDQPAALDLAIRGWQTAKTSQASLAIAHSFSRPLATLQGHSDSVGSAVFSPDGQRILTASADHTARLWNASSGQLLATLQGHSDYVGSAVFSPDGQRILTASADHTARLWNASSGQLLATLQGHSNYVWSAVFSPDGQRILTASYDHTARVWNAGNGQLLATLQGHSDSVGSAVFSPDGQRILTASADHTARVWNASSGQLLATLQGHSAFVSSAVFSPDGQRILTASHDHTARVWNAGSGQLLATLQGHSDPVLSAVFSPDGQRILTASEDHTARVWNASSGQLLATLQGHSNSVLSAVFSPDGQRILTASDDHTARLWNTSSGQLLATLEAHSASVSSAVFSPDGQRILTANDDQTARVWNASSGQLLATLKGHSGSVLSAVFSPDGQRILTASADHTARVFRLVTLSDVADLLAH